MNLATFESKIEETHVFDLLAADSFYHNATLHIGATKMNADGEWYWMKDGEKINYDVNWEQYHPYLNQLHYNCLAVANVTKPSYATYVDGDCDKTHHEFICEQYSH